MRSQRHAFSPVPVAFLNTRVREMRPADARAQRLVVEGILGGASGAYDTEFRRDGAVTTRPFRGPQNAPVIRLSGARGAERQVITDPFTQVEAPDYPPLRVVDGANARPASAEAQR